MIDSYLFENVLLGDRVESYDILIQWLDIIQ